MSLPRIGAEQLRQLLPMTAAVDALEVAFAAESLPEAPLRSLVRADDGELIMMPAVGEQGVGVKLLTVKPDNPERGLPLVQGVYVLFAPGTLEPVALLDGAELTAIRTGGVSALATRHLALPDASRLVIFGAGIQGRGHLEAMLAVRPIEDVVVVSRSPAGAEALAERARELGARASVGDPDAVRDADIVCTCTTSPTPVLNGSLLRPGTHVNAIGAYRPDTRELDDETVRGARIVVETREVAFAEAGDLLIPMATGVIRRENVVADLSELVAGATVRTSEEDRTVFKSVGVAFEDLVVARAAVDRFAS